jgi:TRAP-type C4-dicarboxylate transport system permease small subunit
MSRLFEIIALTLADLAGAALVVLICATLVDIVARHLGLFSVRGAVEIATFSVILVGFLALPYSFVAGGHIVVDLLTQSLPPRAKLIIDLVWMGLSAMSLVYVAFRMWQAAMEVYSNGEYSLDLQAPMIIFWIPAAVGMSLTPIAILFRLRFLLKGQREIVPP